ncbi:MAG: replication factor C large subunit [Candidatus Aenigmarchaeota archaeon]|nr:replication factor C large subunit [Candidatus Aenigmarchaeota archaeon]
MLWVDRHRPETTAGIVGQEKCVSEALQFLNEWKKGKALLISGPPGIGKTLFAETYTTENNLQLVQLNASDKRTKKEIELQLSDASRQTTLFHKGKIILIDEVDGISGRSDRGAGSAILKIIKGSSFPIILIANDPYSSKLSGLKRSCKHVKFQKIRSASISKKLREIIEKENLKIKDEIIDSIAGFSNGDMRSAITDFQTASNLGEDLESLGFRERLKDIYDILPTIFFSQNIKAARKSIYDSDKDPDEVFQWIETNIPKVFKTAEDIACAYELLSKADIFRSRVHKQQNWRFKGLMSDLMVGVSVGTNPQRGFIPYQYPEKIAQLGRTRFKRALRDSFYKKMVKKMHSSPKDIRENIPYLKMIIKGRKREFLEEFDIGPEELSVVLNY